MVSVIRVKRSADTTPRSTSHPRRSKNRRWSDMDVRMNRWLIAVIHGNAKPVRRHVVQRPVYRQAMKHEHVAALVVAGRPHTVITERSSLSPPTISSVPQQTP